jgi:hypothetical protein
MPLDLILDCVQKKEFRRPGEMFGNGSRYRYLVRVIYRARDACIVVAQCEFTSSKHRTVPAIMSSTCFAKTRNIAAVT